MNKIIIEVRDGMVQNVYSDTDKVNVDVLDWDTDDVDENREHDNEVLYNKTKNMKQVW